MEMYDAFDTVPGTTAKTVLWLDNHQFPGCAHAVSEMDVTVVYEGHFLHSSDSSPCYAQLHDCWWKNLALHAAGQFPQSADTV